MPRVVRRSKSPSPQPSPGASGGKKNIVINGSIQVEAVEGQTVSVEARREDGADVKSFLDVEHDGDEVSVSVCCGPCEEGRASRCDNPVPAQGR